ncbi:MAG: metallophosphoesterase [Clostridiales bacterium]|nr:metallophosphoesterase [Clostridiales bacterium]
MSLFAIADTHLSFGTDKPMDIFSGWQDYEKRLENMWRSVVKDDDTVVVAGDISWAMSLEEAKEDFAFLDSLPGTKIIMKGNHDYWWSTKSKADRFFLENNMTTLKILHNNAYLVEGFSLCGTRGWSMECEKSEDKKVLLREVGRLEVSIAEGKKLGGELIVFLHYPPVSSGMIESGEISSVLEREGVKRCYYGHLHGASHRTAVNGEVNNVKYSLISGDYLKFCPKLIEKF